ncbi:MAG: 2-amino-4-hydroxy-6-hydroxymethyldihydropteridine diphosphokinase [Paucibacter sp.]|nr:2-amino-4-hydroxy-6-hydroxymethyldihydropteridine diphosphokinase [Roseateles sp.]
MTEAFVGLGANLGDKDATLHAALAALAALPGTRLLAASGFYRSAPVEASGPEYLNAVACIETELPAETLLDALQAIEQAHGRERPYINAPRTLDMDLLLYGDQSVATPRLTVPHPRMTQRAFVLLPLLEIAPGRQDLAAHLLTLADQRIERQ